MQFNFKFKDCKAGYEKEKLVDQIQEVYSIDII